MNERLIDLFRRQQATAFGDLRGADVSVRLPVSERLLNEVIAETLPRSAPVRELHVKPQARDRFAIRTRVGASPLLPPINLTLAVDQQPRFPDDPVLVLRLETSGLLSLAGPVLRLMNALPLGIRVEHRRIYVDLRTLAEAHGFASYLQHLDDLRVNTEDGTVILSMHATIRD